MKMILNATGILLVAAALASTPSYAGKIGGNVTQEAEVDTATNVAAGYDVKAVQKFNSIHEGANVGGNVTQRLEVDTATNVAAGYKAEACQAFNTVGGGACD